jgi:hypothetical protein
MMFKFSFYTVFVLLSLFLTPFTAMSQNWDVKTLKMGYCSELVYCAQIDRIFVAAENKIVIVNPNLGTITDSIVVGGSVSTSSNIYKIAVSDDGKYLYYTKYSDLKVTRFNLLTKLKEFEFTPNEGFNDIEVMPGRPQTVAITRANSRDVAIYDGAVRRPRTTQAPFDVITNITFAYNDSTTIYASQDWSTSNHFSVVKVDNQGATIKSKTYDFVREFGGRFAASKDGFAYTNNGIKINLNAAATPIKEGIYGERGNSFLLNYISSGFYAADPILDKVYCLVEGRDLYNQTDSTQLAVFNKKTFNLEQIYTFPIKFSFGGYRKEMIECGTAKLATITNDKLILIRQCASQNATKPTILEGIKKEGCYNGTVTLTASGNAARYVWSTGDTGRVVKISPNVSVYQQVISVAAVDTEGCLSPYSTPTTVTFEQQPNRPDLVVRDQKTTTCRGDSINLLASNVGFNYNIVWSNGATGISTWVQQTGDYSFYAVSPNGCPTPSAFAQRITVLNFNTPPQPTITVEQGDTVLCQGASVTLSSPVGYSLYKWSNGDNTRVTTLTPNNSQSISVQVSDANGCQSGPSVPVALTVGYKPFLRPVITLNGNILASSVAQGNQWFLNGTAVQGATQQFFTPTQTGSYTVKYLENSCFSDVSNSIQY